MSSKPGSDTPSLFPESSESAPARRAPSQQVEWITANVDGGARGNPGPAGYGAYIRGADGKTIAQLSEYLGIKTNNFAEYSALIGALEYAIAHGYRALKVISDSELMVRQMTGQYRVNSPDLKPMYERARSLVRQLDKFAIEHVVRAKNQHADRLANEAMDRGMGKTARGI
ncbi:MAG TPA: ribonuclease HI family protein [Terriglobales bacterium]|jgi:ribonuclease HI|nr:ribonuclease HI family protein [Terriglobales bacterium]